MPLGESLHLLVRVPLLDEDSPDVFIDVLAHVDQVGPSRRPMYHKLNVVDIGIPFIDTPLHKGVL